MDVGKLIGQHGERAGEDVDGVRRAVAQVDEVAAKSLVAHPPDEIDDGRLGEPVKCLAHPAGQAQAA